MHSEYRPFMTRKGDRASSSRLLFLIGLFSVTQLRLPGFSLCISEIPIYLIAPFLFFRNYRLLRQHGMLFFVWFGVAVSCMCVISGLYNHVYPFFIFKGLSSTYPLFAFPVVLHHLLWRNFNGLRWLLLGMALSMVISTFAFQTSVEVASFAGGETGAEAAEAIMRGPIFWIGRLQNLVTLPIYGWYLHTPLVYSVLGPIGLAAFSMLTSTSGRSVALGALGGAFIAILCGKTSTSLRRFGRNFFLILVVALLWLFIVNKAYHVAAEKGWLGRQALEKYEKQTKGSTSILKLLMGGRGEAFIAFFAALDKPIMGHGPWAIDTGDYVDKFMSKYGDSEDYEKYAKSRAYQYRTVGTVYHYIPAHSHIFSFWLWFGIVGLFYWLYILYSIFRYFHKEMAAVPQWVGFLAVGAPAFLWNIFFSGMGIRIYTVPYLVVLIMAHNVYKGRIMVPLEEQKEIAAVERRGRK